MTSGRRSNLSGSQLETAVQAVLSSKGFEIANYRDIEKQSLLVEEEVLIKNVPYTSIYGHRGKTEFLLKSKKFDIQARIECKWQQVSGSVDEKLPYLYLNAARSMPEKTILLIIDGAGWKQGAIDWLRHAVDFPLVELKPPGKEILVFSLTEFFTWANQRFN